MSLPITNAEWPGDLDAPARGESPADAPISVRLVLTRSDVRDFCAVPHRLHRHDRLWIAPLAGQDRTLHARGDDVQGRTICRFVARRRGIPIGRIAAITDRTFAARWAGGGFFGFFECINNRMVARALFECAERALRSEGINWVFGPVNLTTHDEVGFLVDGFGSPPMVLTPYNPPYYPRLALAAGYRVTRQYHAFSWSPDLAAPPFARRLAARLKSSSTSGITVRPLDVYRWETEVQTLWKLYNSSFANNWGFVPMPWVEFLDRARAFRQFYRPDLLLIAEVHGHPAAFAMILPDINSVIAPLRGRLFPFGWLHLARNLKRITRGRLILLGALPEHFGQGLSAILVHELMSAAKRLGLSEVEISLVDDSNERMLRVVRAFGVPRTKSFSLFQKHL